MALLNIAEYLFWFLIVLSVLVFVHEWGHYWVAKKCGVKIESFSIGFGREIFGWNDKSGTRWKFSLISLGGYVKMFGDADPASRPDDASLQGMTEEEKKYAFYHQPLRSRVAIVAAGPLANFLLAIVLLWGYFAVAGETVIRPIIGHVLEATPAAEAGLLPGDEILAINGRQVHDWMEMTYRIKVNLGREMIFTVLRDGAEVTLPVTPRIITERHLRRDSSLGQVGITNAVPQRDDAGDFVYDEEGNQLFEMDFALREIDYNIASALPRATVESYRMGAITMTALRQLVTGERSVKELGGPIQIAEVSGKRAQLGIASLITFMALLSINLGLINLFPIPVLDGGHLVFYAIEGLRGKPLSQKAQEWGFTVGLVFIASLMLFVFSNDILHLPGPNCIFSPAGSECETLGEFGRKFFG